MARSNQTHPEISTQRERRGRKDRGREREREEGREGNGEEERERKRRREGGWQEAIKHTSQISPAGYQREVNEIRDRDTLAGTSPVAD